MKNYWTFFKPELAKLGYDSVYLARPSLKIIPNGPVNKRKMDVVYSIKLHDLNF